MRLTTMTDYALRLLMYVAQHPDRLCTIAEVARAHAISESHLMKVTQALGHHGWLETVRGKGGGIRLARAPAQVGLGAVVRDVEADFRLVECMGAASACRITGNCRLRGIVQGALDSFVAHLDRHTLADLITPSGASATLLRIETAPGTPAGPG